MKTAKQEAIEKLWREAGVNIDDIKDSLDENGYYHTEYIANDYQNMDLEPTELDFLGGRAFRPNTLTGIENNLGWIRIESEEDLPKEEGRYYTISNQNDEIVTMKFPVEKFDLEFNRQWWLKYITHYQKVTLPERPIY